MYHSTNVIYMKTKRILTWLWAIICGTYALASETKNSERWTIWSSSPASRWEDAFVTGNGQHGTMVWGNPIDERITCVHEELFIRGWDRHLKAVPSNRLEFLKGSMKGGKKNKYSIRVNKQYRILFEYIANMFCNVELVDYHI